MTVSIRRRAIGQKYAIVTLLRPHASLSSLRVCGQHDQGEFRYLERGNRDGN
jgi:hypothetical protein